MRIHKLLATVLAAGLVFSGCHQDEDYLLPDIEINAESLDFSDDTELKISLTASRDWLVRSKPDWVAVDPDHGSASSAPQRVVISVLPNNDYNRTGEVLFTIGLDKAAVEVIQPGAKGEKPRGSGTLEDPYTVGGAVEYISGLAEDAAITENVYIKGTISSINEEISAQYGNGTFYITDDSGATFYVFRTMYLGNAKWTANDTQIKTGDEVVICGQVVNYKGNTPETVANKSYIYSLNGETRGSGGGGNAGTPSGEGTQASPYNVAAAIAAVANLTWTSTTDYQTTNEVYVKGKISRIADNGTFSESGTFGNATFYISDDGTQNGEFYVFRALYLGNAKYASGTDIKVGDEVIIYGKLMNYRGNTPETATGAYLYSLNGTTAGGSSSGGEQGGSQGGEQGGGQTTADVKTVTVAQFNAAEVSSTQKYQLTGTIGGTINETYGNFDLTDETGKVYVYGLTESEKALTVNADGTFKANNDKSYSNLGLKAGDVVTIIGYRSVFNNQIQVLGTYYVKHEAGSSQGGEQGSGTIPGNSDGSVTYTKVSSITSGTKYVFVGVKDNKYYAATPLASDKTYGRLNGKEITVSSDQITEDLFAYEFTITATDGGYTDDSWRSITNMMGPSKLGTTMIKCLPLNIQKGFSSLSTRVQAR